MTNIENILNYIILAFRSIDCLQFIPKCELVRPVLFEIFIFKILTKQLGLSGEIICEKIINEHMM